MSSEFKYLTHKGSSIGVYQITSRPMNDADKIDHSVKYIRPFDPHRNEF